MQKHEWEDSAARRDCESSSSGQSGALEEVPEFLTLTDTEASTCDVVTSVEPAAELWRCSRTHPKPEWLSDGILLLDNDKPATYT